ncbi:MAG TPA: pseudouridine synthase [Rhodanobacteraceae bacterium]|nr:pseudouridine synthase [Rhodanobacteraceae bacterium]
MRAPRAKRSKAELARPRHGVARVISKLGVCSRTQAARYVAEGRVAVNGRVVRDPETPVDAARDRVTLDGEALAAAERIYLALNKPRGYITTAADERGRETVYALLAGAGLPWIAPVGRLDKASEGLLLLSNDSAWAARITSPDTKVDKTYHVQIDRVPDAALLASLRRGIEDRGEFLGAKQVAELRRGSANSWLEIVLDEGRNRQIRRLLAAYDVGVLRLVRVAIGPVALGRLGKGQFRRLDAMEVAAFAR